MQKKKKLYIIIMIIATVVLIADVIVFAVSKPSFAGGRGDGMGDFQMGEMPSFEGGEMPSFEGGEMPSFEGGEMPSFEGGEMPSFGEGEMPEGMEMPAGGFGIGRIICIVIGILCILVDSFCGFKLFKIRKQEKANPHQITGDDEARAIIEEVLDPAAERMKKQKKSRRTMMALIAVLLIFVLVLQTLSSGVKENSSASVEEEVITAQAENGDISQTLKSSGILAAADSESIAVPGDITVTKYLVSNGDYVEAGDAIAAVEKNSVMAAISDVQELIDAVDTEILAQKDASISSSMKAAVGGTVVTVYAKDGEDVVDTMYEKGALMLISLDDLLAVTIENPGNLTVGDKVKVIDSDKKKHTGKVASIEKETVEITVPLDEFDYKEKVTVKNSDGKKLGSGKLYIYSQQKITGYSGTIGDVKVSKGDTVKEGTVLLTLENTDYTAAYQTLMNKRIVLEDQYNRLVEIAGTGYVYVKEAGTISGIDEEILETTATGGLGVMLDYLTSSDEMGEVVLPEDGSGEDTNGSGDAGSEGETPGDGSGNNEQAVTTSKSVNIVWLNSDGSVMTEGYPESMIVELYADGAVIDTVEISAEDEWAYTWTGLPAATEEGVEIIYTIGGKEAIEGYSTVAQVSGTVTVIINTKEAVPGQQPGENTPDNEQGNIPQDGQTQMPGNQQGMPNGTGSQQGMPGGQGMAGMSGMPSGFNVAGVSGSSAMASAVIEEEEDPTYVFGETTLCALTPDDGMKVDITIDELDILAISMGQECEITMDAFPGQSFEGKVAGIGQSGTSSGGNAKYTVTISLTKETDMLLGMNASVKLVMDTEENVLAIPEEALVEQEGKVYVYTEYDEKKDELGGMTEVVTGLSDGQNVQIIEGLEAGQEYYYRYADTISYSFIK